MHRIVSLVARLPSPLRRGLRAVPGLYRMRARLYGRPAATGPAPGQPKPVVYLPTWLRWDQMRQRPQNLLAEFGRAGHPVYFVDPRESVERRDGPVRIVPDLTSVPGHSPILYVHFAPARTLFGRFDDPVVVYDVLDDLSIYVAGERGLARRWRVSSHHPALMAEADVVMVSMEVLAERHRTERADLLVVENGVEVDRFSAPTTLPDDLPAGTGPLVGFHGAVAGWFDFKLFAEVAARLPDWRFVVVGPIDPTVAGEAAGLTGRPNVDFIGERPGASMPAYVQAFDIGAIWFRINAMTQAVSPLKMYECLAAGKPVVATPLPACQASPSVQTAGTTGEFVEALLNAAGRIDDAGRRAGALAEASAADWGVRIQPLLDRLTDLGVRNAPL